MKEYNEAEFIPRFKVGSTVKIKLTGKQAKITKVGCRTHLQTGKETPKDEYEVRFEDGSIGQYCEDGLMLCCPES
jgi:hypothetical protein